MVKKVLFVLSSHSKFGDTGKTTGWYLSEASHVWHSLHSKGIEVDFVSPLGGEAPIDPSSLDTTKDLVNKEFLDNSVIAQKIKTTLTPSQVNAKDYSAIHYVGGHGTVYDFPDNKELSEIARAIYEDQNGVVSAVCHGPAGILNIKLKSGENLINGKKVAGFTNGEEEAIQLTNVVPFSLENELKKRGANYQVAANWSSNVQVDNRLITGQNPQSAKELGEKLTQLLQ